VSRIAFCGAHGTGKSTLYDAVAAYDGYKDYHKMATVARRRPKGFSDRSNQGYVNRTYLIEHFLHKDLISARSIFDAWAYSRLNCGLTFYNTRFKIGTELIKYDFLFYIPPEIELKYDNYRPLDITYQKNVDLEIRILLNLYNVKYHTITGSIAERINTIKRILSL
jgi:hypothetical protein